jgi:hypothetical protein
MKTASSQIVTGLSTLVITVDPKFSLVIGVTAGWNLVSFPGINKLGMTPDLLFANRTAGYSVYAFSGGAYNVISTLQPGTGYWLNHTATGTQYNWSTSGSPTPLRGKLMYSVNTHVSANAGWNMIGSYEYNADVNFIRTMPENKRTAASIYKYTPGAGYSPVSSLTPGLGYWINLNGAATVYLPGSFAGTLGKEAATIFETLKHNNGQIVVTDAIGQSYTLYNTNASVDFKMFELPPLPPAGIFDVRFGSQRLAEDLSSMQTINLTGVVYPVTIKVSGMNLNLVDAIDGSIVNTTVNNGNSFVITDKNVNVLKVASGMITPTDYTLEQNYPNPFNPATTIKFSIPEVSDVKLTIYNALGQKVAELVNSTLEIGSYSFNWDASNVASGMYFYELSTKNFSSVKKMMLLK